VTLRIIRIWLPVVVCVLGVVLFILDPSADTAMGSAAIIGAGLSIWLLNVLFRMGVKGDQERDDEADARRFFDQHGHWPDEPPPPSDAPPRHRHRGSTRPRPPRRPV
jgi:hypothetical protein